MSDTNSIKMLFFLKVTYDHFYAIMRLRGFLTFKISDHMKPFVLVDGIFFLEDLSVPKRFQKINIM